jgi:hypothetical protein
MSLVRYRTNDYSVPVEWGHRAVLVKGFVHEVVICVGSEVIEPIGNVEVDDNGIAGRRPAFCVRTCSFHVPWSETTKVN